MSRSLKIVLGVLSATVLVLVLLAVFAGSGLYGSDVLNTGQDGMMHQDGMMRGDGIMNYDGMMRGDSIMNQDGMMRGDGMMGQRGRIGWGWGIVGMLVPLLFIGGLVAVVVWAVTRTGSGRNAPGRYGSGGVHERSAEETLRQRFARGEINAEEYEERHRVLNEGSPSAHR